MAAVAATPALPLLNPLNFNGASGVAVRDAVVRTYRSGEADVFASPVNYIAGIFIAEHGAGFEPAKHTTMPATYSKAVQNAKVALKSEGFQPEGFLNYNSDLVVSEDMKLKEFGNVVTRGRR